MAVAVPVSQSSAVPAKCLVPLQPARKGFGHARRGKASPRRGPAPGRCRGSRAPVHVLPALLSGVELLSWDGRGPESALHAAVCGLGFCQKYFHLKR